MKNFQPLGFCHKAARMAFVLALITLFSVQLIAQVRAGTTGVISGRATSATTRAPLAGVRVSASSPTGHYTAVTNSAGFYSMTGVTPDTYTVSFSAGNLETLNLQGVTVSADQTASANAVLRQAVKTIGTIPVRATAAGAFQPTQTVDTYTVSSQQINTVLGTSFNLSESDLITSLPGATYDANGYPVIHGGRENEEGFEFEGIPYVDAFTSQFTNALANPGLGLQSAQLTPGGGDATFGNTGTGTVNLIAKRGSYPGFSTVAFNVGGPNFRHQFNAEYGTATPNGKWSEYATFAGQNIAPLYGGSASQDATFIHRFYSERLETDREFLNNLVYHFGNNNAQSLQFFIDSANHQFFEGYGGNNLCFKSCDPYYDRTMGAFFGLTPQQTQTISPLDFGQTSAVETLAQSNRAPYTYYEPNNTFKLQYDNNLSSSTFFSTKFYRDNAVTVFDFPYSGASPFALASHFQQGGQTTGMTAELTRQINEQNLLQLGGDYSFLHPVFDQPTSTYGLFNNLGANLEMFDFISPADPNCPIGTDANGTSYCGFLAGYFPSGIPRIPAAYESSISNRNDSSLFISDKYSPSDKFRAEIGLRLDSANYRLPTPGIDPTTCTSLYLPSSFATPGPNAAPGTCPAETFNVTNDEIKPRVLEPRLGLTFNPTTRDSFRATYGRSVLFAPLGQVDLYSPQAWYGAFNGVPSYSGFNAFAQGLPAGTISSATQAGCGITGYQVPCTSYGQQLWWDNVNNFTGVPIQPVKPETFNNYQLTYQHQFNNEIGFSVAPWYRRGYNATALVKTPKLINGQPVVNPDGTYVYNPAIATNNGVDFASGVDLRVTRDVPYGLAGQFTATYINEFSNVIPLSGNEDFFPGIPPASLALGNLYRVGFLSPFQSVLTLNYKTHDGWSIKPRYYYDVGYPIGSGYLTSVFINGKAYNIINTNASAAINSAPSGAVGFIDPMNPGSYFAPNVAATYGTGEAQSPGGVLSHPESTADLTIEYTPARGPKTTTFGLNVLNLFNQQYGGVLNNPYYQPVATGISGPLSGQTRNSYRYPQLGIANYDVATQHGGEQYANVRNLTGRQYYFYVELRR